MTIIDPNGKLARFAIGGVGVIALAAWLCAQYQTQQPHAMGQINPQVNSELYGHGTTNSVKYNALSSVPMNSELRHAYWQSGATPSDIRMGYAALGPMTPGGPISYIPPPPSYTAKPVAATPPALGAAAYGSAATIRYSAPAPGLALPAPRAAAPMGSRAPVTAGAINAGPINNSVRYSR